LLGKAPVGKSLVPIGGGEGLPLVGKSPGEGEVVPLVGKSPARAEAESRDPKAVVSKNRFIVFLL
jgi:hypothetical protein